MSGLSSGALANYRNNLSPQGQAARSDAKLRKEQGEQELAYMQRNKEQLADFKDQQLAMLQRQQKQQTAQLVRNDTYSAFDKYNADGNVRHLNNMLKNVGSTEEGKNAFGNIVRVDKLNPNSEDDMNLVARTQGQAIAQAYKDNPEFQHDLVKVIKTDGTVVSGSVSELQGLTGYNEYTTDKNIARQTKLAQSARYTQMGYKTQDERLAAQMVEAEGLDLDTPEGRDRYIELLKELGTTQGRGTADERMAESILKGEGLDKNSPEGLRRYNEVLGKIRDDKAKTSKIKNLDAADDVRNKIFDDAGGTDKFYSTDFTEAKNRIKYEADIQRYEELADVKLSDGDKKTLSYISELIALGAPGSELGDEETGIIDRLFIDTRKYLSDNTKGLDATSAYAAFRNTIRRALFGLVVTPSELQSFNEQFGTLKQQTGPVLTQFRTALEQVKTQLQNLYNTNDSIVMTYRAGMDKRQLDKVLDALDERIDAFGKFIRTKTRTNNAIPGAIPDFKEGQSEDELNSILGINQ